MSLRSSQTPTKLTTCYFKISIGGKDAGQILIDLFQETPKTSENFRAIATGENNIGANYAGTIFHRVIEGFMLQGGDYERRNGTGGKCIYPGGKFEDENFLFEHDKPFKLSMANAGPATNGSQFFITVAPTPHLNGKHVVFGEVSDKASQDLVMKIAKGKTGRGDLPINEVKIVASGELK